ncbi:MAG: radical SAM protein, partial [Clostridiales bacterium]
MGKCDTVRCSRIDQVKNGSIGEEAGLEKGDRLLKINGKEVKDILDYIYLINDEYLLVEVEKTDGEIWEIEIEKEYDEDLGIIFISPTMDDIMRCHNKCLFCFVDQMPEGMRSSLYVKDDDYRLSVLHGNFATFTNLSESDIERIIELHISPINISVHATDPKLRIRMMGNKRAGEIMKQIKAIADHNISMNGQIVLCPGINDGKALENTLNDLESFFPHMQSIAIVPVGLTKFRKGLYKLEKVDKEKAMETIELVESKQKEYKEKYGKAFVYLSDEFYIIAEKEFPDYDDYEGFLQIENGVGIARKFERQIIDALGNKLHESTGSLKIAMATGVLSYDFIVKMAKIIERKIEGLSIEVVKIENEFFGKDITVAGLISGKDLSRMIPGIEAETVLVPGTMIKEGTKLTVDDLNIEEIGKSSIKK